MLILVGVSISILINSDLIGTAQDARSRTETSYREEGSMSAVTIGGKTYNSIEEYISQSGETETEANIVIGAYIEGYNPAVAADGSTISTTYISKGTAGDGTIAGGATGNGYTDQTFTVSSITSWRIVGEEDGQIIITTADPIQTVDATSYYMKGQAGYVNFVDELNKISSIYGQGKYANTSKFSYNLNGTTISSGGRSISLEDLNCEFEPATVTYTINEAGYVCKDGEASVTETMVYWGEDAVPSEGAQWIELTSEDIDGVTIAGHQPWGTGPETWTTLQEEMIYLKSDGSTEATYWLANQYKIMDGSGPAYGANGVWGFAIFGAFGQYLYLKGASANEKCLDVRPVVYLQSDIELSYDSKTEVYTIVK